MKATGMLRARHAYSTLWWIGFYTFCLVPIVTLGVGLGRYFYARAELFKSADGAALAAAQEVDVAHYIATGEIVLLPSAVTRAAEYAAYNSDYLVSRRIYPRVTGIRVDDVENTVYVSLDADASSLFPRWLGGVVVRGQGQAQVRVGSR